MNYYFFLGKLSILLTVSILLANCSKKQIPPYKDPEKSVEERVNDLCDRLTLEEKANFMSGKDSWHFEGVPRLDVPSLQATDCGHGVTVIIDEEGRWSGNATCFPTAVGQAASWNRALVKDVGAAIAREARATGSNILLAPMVNIKRSPLNGRNYEVFSEDPYLSGIMANSFISGVQSENIISVIKALIANNQQTDQHNLDVQLSERPLREIYMPSFKMPRIHESPWGIMTSYNRLNGFQTSENSHILQDILKCEWNYKGFVVSDWRAVESMEALYAGVDVEMPGPGKFMTRENVIKEVKNGKLTEEKLDEKVKRILRALVKAKVLDYGDPQPNGELNSEKHQNFAREVAEESIVLLKNQKEILPLDQSVDKIAVIGPNAHEARLGGGGSASVTPFYSVSPLEGLKNRVGNKSEIIFEEGCGLNGNLKLIDREYLNSEVHGKETKGLKGSYFNNRNLKGEPGHVRADHQIGFSWGWASPAPDIASSSYSARWTGKLVPPVTGTYKIGVFRAGGGYRLFINGKQVMGDWEFNKKENFEAKFTKSGKIVELSLKENEPVNIRLEFNKWDNKNQIRLEWEIPGSDPIQLAKNAAAESDVAVVFAGLSNFFEGGNNDRPNIDLPGEQNRLIREVARANENTIVVLINGAPVSMPWLNEVNALLEAYYPGQEGGNAIANVLFGDVNPSGKLPETFPVELDKDHPVFGIAPPEQNKIEYKEGIFVGYRYYEKHNIEPLFPFGFGLSYTEFAYDNLEIEKEGQQVLVKLDVKNIGERKGAEVVQLYVRDEEASVERPEKELKNFRKVFLDPGDKKTVELIISDDDLAFYSEAQSQWVVEEGKYHVLVGSSSADIRLSGSFEE